MDPAATGPEPRDPSQETLQESYHRLRYLFHCVSISLLVLTGVVFVFIYRQVVLINQQTKQLVEEIAEFQESGVPQAIDELRRQLHLFTQENPDFTPIFVRYFGTNQPPDEPAPVIAPADSDELPEE